jgi:hypothetical protein
MSRQPFDCCCGAECQVRAVVRIGPLVMGNARMFSTIRPKYTVPLKHTAALSFPGSGVPIGKMPISDCTSKCRLWFRCSAHRVAVDRRSRSRCWLLWFRDMPPFGAIWRIESPIDSCAVGIERVVAHDHIEVAWHPQPVMLISDESRNTHRCRSAGNVVTLSPWGHVPPDSSPRLLFTAIVRRRAEAQGADCLFFRSIFREVIQEEDFRLTNDPDYAFGVAQLSNVGVMSDAAILTH